jgi:nicotinamide riboside transporter PnuC
MKLLKRSLYWEAGILAVSGLFAAAFPRWLLETVFAQPAGPDVWVRVAGVQAIGFAMFAVVVAHRIEELWWASWAFVITGASVAVATAGYALFGVPDGVSTVLWWLMAVESVAITAGLLVGLAQTGTERDPNAPVSPEP